MSEMFVDHVRNFSLMSLIARTVFLSTLAVITLGTCAYINYGHKIGQTYEAKKICELSIGNELFECILKKFPSGSSYPRLRSFLRDSSFRGGAREDGKKCTVYEWIPGDLTPREYRIHVSHENGEIIHISPTLGWSREGAPKDNKDMIKRHFELCFPQI
jgi:hypothetical protein